MAGNIGTQRAFADDIEQRIAAFWQRIDALQPSDYVSSADLGQWALFVIERNARARLTVADFRVVTAEMQGAMDQAGNAPTVPPSSSPPPSDLEQRLAAFWQRINVLQTSDYVSSGDLGQWALFVVQRNALARLTVADFRVVTAEMQGAMDRAGDAPTVPTTPVPTATPSPASAACHISANGLPDPSCTPGAPATTVTQANIGQTICVVGYTDTVRPSSSYTTALKIQQMAQYGFTGTTGDYEEDHLISLELGGSPTDPRNLWPEPYNILYGARQKDRVENALHDQVCSAQITLASAQQQIASNWVAVYVSLYGAATPTPIVTPAPTTPSPTTSPTTGALTVTITTSIYGAVAATTTPGASCSARARLPSGNYSSASGLQASVTADANGGVRWTYGTNSLTTPGTGTHTVTCSWQGSVASTSAPFTVP